MEHKLIHNKKEKRYEFHIDESILIIEYAIREKTIILTHIHVPEKLEGRGLAKELLKKTLEDIEYHKYKVVSRCPFIVNYLKKNPLNIGNKKVLLLLAQGFEEYEASVFTDVMGWSREEGEVPVDLITVGLRSEIKCTWNLTVKPEIYVKDVDSKDYDALAIPGGFEEAGFYEDAFDDDFLNIIREFNEQGKAIASICVGALPIARAGILKGRKATTYDLSKGHRRKQLSEYGAIVQDEKIVIDKNIITSTGPATSLDVAFKLLEILTDVDNVNTVKKAMRFE